MRQEKQLLLDEIKGQIEHYRFFCHHALSKLLPIKPTNFVEKSAKLGGNVEVVRKRVLIKAAEACWHCS